ncbi:MAG TPA: SpoIIE family protein phosphatase [Balneolaceae bacterium]|nr:SpoIIE family protein phosphatase [Balneolaceae bacterium]
MMKRMGRINIRVYLPFIVLITILFPIESRGGHAGHHLPDKHFTALPLFAAMMNPLQQFSGSDENGNQGQGSSDEVNTGETGNLPSGFASEEISESSNQFKPVEEIGPESLNGDQKVFYISDLWRYRPGDNLNWANSGYDDEAWELVSTNLTTGDLSFIEWDTIGWFRKKVNISPLLAGKPVALIVDRHLGASEVYLNGRKVLELGTFSKVPGVMKPYEGNELPMITFQEGVNTLAVRYMNPHSTETEGFFGYNGFRFLLGDWQANQTERERFLQSWTGMSMFYLGVLFTFCLLHFLLFLFYPKEKRNLYFSLFTGGLMVITYILYRLELIRYTVDTIQYLRYAVFFEIFVLVFAVRFMHTIDQTQKKIHSNLILLAGLTAAVIVWIYPAHAVWLRDIVILVLIVELIRLLVLMFRRKRQGVWVIGAGMIVFVLAMAASVLINFHVISGRMLLVNVAGSGLLILSMSVFLSREFAATQHRLERKLREVKELSHRALEQERINSEKEMETRLLEAENARKTRELEEARTLQLSMLPRKLPESDFYDMSVYMDTATEVGGDYYDYTTGPGNTLTFALGDATGHGMKAGIMVAAAKSYFHSLAREANVTDMLKRMSAGLNNMNMKMMYMGLVLARCHADQVEITSAGMPPVLHYKKELGTVERVVLKSLPLGSSIEFPYESRKAVLTEGDLLLLMSDGLTELFNPEREMLGLKKIEEVLKNSDGMKSGDIVNQLTQLIKTWSGGKEPEDDITFLILKYTGNQA